MWGCFDLADDFFSNSSSNPKDFGELRASYMQLQTIDESGVEVAPGNSRQSDLRSFQSEPFLPLAVKEAVSVAVAGPPPVADSLNGSAPLLLAACPLFVPAVHARPPFSFLFPSTGCEKNKQTNKTLLLLLSYLCMRYFFAQKRNDSLHDCSCMNLTHIFMLTFYIKWGQYPLF